MTEAQVKLITVLVAAAFGLIVIPIIYSIIKRLIGFISFKSGRALSFGKALGVFSVLLIAAIWCLRYAVGYYSIITSTGNITLTPFEEVIHSILNALQTFAMGADYEQYILTGKEMMLEVTGKAFYASFFGVFAFILNLIAPIAGGAIVFEVLAGIFPKIRLMCSYPAVFKEKNYFSELNERSVALAKSIVNENKSFWRPVIVFTDSYFAKNEEKSSELLSVAKSIGAVCVREDLKHIPKPKYGSRKFFLIDNNEMSNLQTLIDLSDAQNSKYMKNADIYLFSQNDIYTRIEEQVREKFINEYGYKENELNIYPVQSGRNLVSNLLTELPLYEPIVNKKADKKGVKDLNVTIIGGGEIAAEMFLSTYWFGQILNCRLNITVVSEENEDSFKARVNPEIFRTADKDDPILCYNKNGEKNEPYFAFKYIQKNEPDSNTVLNTDYFMIALGEDCENLCMAEKIRVNIGRTPNKCGKKAVIAYMVYNSELCDTLNRKKHYSFYSDGADVYMRAFGSLKEIYSQNNIFMTKHQLLAKEIGKAYTATRSEYEKANEQRLRDDYNYWANLSRAMHIKYKAFSLGLITTSVFDTKNEDDSAHINSVSNALLNYREKAKESGEIKHSLAWLEHRRWCAFTRVKGFNSTADYLDYYPHTGSYKNMSLKLHPCLIECSKEGFGAGDYLDDLSDTLMEKGINNYDFKTYDYPEYEF